MPVTILAPHHDDAVLSCWSVLTAPDELRVLNVFAGVPPAGSLGWWDRETGAADSAERMRERRREDAEALALAGRAAIDLDFLEDQYRGGSFPSLAELLRAVRPHLGGGAVYAPAGIGGHRDHLLLRALADVLRREGADVRLFAELPYAARQGWPAQAERVRLDPAAQQLKRRALAAYRTQRIATDLRFEAFWKPPAA